MTRRMAPLAYYMMTEASATVYGQVIYTTLIKKKNGGWVLSRYTGIVARPNVIISVKGQSAYAFDVTFTGRADVSSQVYKDAVVTCLALNRRIEPAAVVNHIYRFVKGKIHA